jgi:ribosomal protein L31
MNDSSDERTPLITRRTVAKTAAWAAPAIAFAAASPAHATSPSQVAMIVLDEAYEVPEGGTLKITGTLVPAPGDSVPAGIQLDASFSGGTGFTVVESPVVTGNTFTLTVKAGAGATTATLTVSSWSHGAYTPGTAALTVGAPAGVILVGKPSYDVMEGGAVSVRGTLQAPQGGTLPEDIVLVATCSNGFEVLVQPLVTGSTYELLIGAASAVGTTGTVTVSSSSHPTYTPGRAALAVTASDVPIGKPQLEFDQQLFTAPTSGPVAITGKIVPGGTPLPAGFRLTAQSANAAWQILGEPTMTGPDTFSVIVTAPVPRSLTYIMLWSSSHPSDFGFPISWVKNFEQ